MFKVCGMIGISKIEFFNFSGSERVKNKFLNFSETKKFSTESFLTFREIQPLVSYKRVSYKKVRVVRY